DGYSLNFKGRRLVVPPGYYISLSGAGLSYDQAVWTHPDRFNPLRTKLGEGKGVKLADLPFRSHVPPLNHSPVSSGTHGCPGRLYALATMRCYLQSVLKRYSYHLDTPMSPLNFQKATLPQRSGPVMVT